MPFFNGFEALALFFLIFHLRNRKALKGGRGNFQVSQKVRMNPVMINKVLIISLSLFCFACSTLSPQKKSLPNEDEQQEASSDISEQKAYELAQEKLEAITNEALKAGPEAVTYLSSDLFVKASDASNNGDAQTAVFLFKYLMKLKPKDLFLKKKYAIELIRIGQLKDAEVLLAEIFKAGKEKEEAIGLILGGVLTALDEGDRARIVYEKVFKNNQKSEEACVFLAKSYALDSLYTKATKLLKSCQKLMPKAAVFSYYQGKIALDQKKMSLALKLFSKALEIDSTYYQAALGQGLIYEEKEQYSKAIKIYKGYLKRDADNYTILSRLVQLLFVTEKSEKVIPYAEQLSNLDPSDLNLKVRLGVLYTDSEKYAQAKSVFGEILAAVPNSDKVLYYLASLHLQTGEDEQALTYFSRVPSSSGLFHDSNIQIAKILHVQAKSGVENDDKQSVKRFVSFIEEAAQKHEGLRLELKVVLTSFHEETHNYSEAIEILSSLRKEKGYDEGHDYYLASLYEKNDDVPQARSIMEEIIEKNPQNAHALNFLGYSFLERGDELEKAYEYISRAVKLRPNDGFIRDSLGWYYYKTGDLQRAYKEIKRAQELVKDDVVITKHLALIYQEMEKYDKAKQYYMEALKNCKVESERAEVLKALEHLEKIRLPASQ